MYSLEAIKYKNQTLEIIDQLLLPTQTKYVTVKDVNDGWLAIKNMQVRGAPAIAIVGCLSLAVDLANRTFENKPLLEQDIIEKLNYLVTSRPTAVNIKLSRDVLVRLAATLSKNPEVDVKTMKAKIISEIEGMLDRDIADNRAIGDFGAEKIISLTGNSKVNILTHCNTGSLATAGYGTALGVVRSIHTQGCLDNVYFTETRPYNQGARLTAYELVHDKVPSTLITDNMVAALMKSKKIAAVVVGADRVAANGDTANKIGTYQIAILAKHHEVPFFVAAPFTSIDATISSGDDIIIEERPAAEITHIGSQQIAADGVTCWNPSFDVTPAHLITGIITEKGVFDPSDLQEELRKNNE